jgi:hypothetical protein
VCLRLENGCREQWKNQGIHKEARNRKGGEAQEDEEEQHNSNTIATHGEAQEDEEEAVKYQRADTAHPSQKQCVITEAMFRQRSGDACKYT